ncbi:putative lipid II flippase FtsW [Aneurinibacillus tyrosinisolvens]|uniref:putative lipid II flippase FtsW n=1 Tax=Aneurinibacillus tyrosinisolvens TaxID=1443435 RepID=UPI00063FD298|nr:putative lipid II flippase FtsW [Aneurinibacillus tyrosinisolvens]
MKTRGKPDFLLLILTLLLVGFGIVMVYSASSVFSLYKFHNDTYFMKKQLMWALIGITAMFSIMNVPYTFFKKSFVPIMVTALFILAAVLIPGIGTRLNGARSWISLGAFSVQPAEFAKLAVIIYLSALIAKKGEHVRHFKKGFMPSMVIVGAFFLIIAKQPDFGSATILALTAAAVIFAGGANLKHLAALGVVFSIFSIIYIVTSPYRWARIANFSDPWADGANGLDKGFQLMHSYFALAHGGIAGAGFGKSIEKFLYLPEAQTDFIFAIMSEELGFIGGTLFLLIYLFYLWRIITVTLRLQDPFANLMGIGVVSMIFIQAFINIGGVTGLIPITGVPLPFISYGGSSLLVNMISIGIVLSISRETYKQELKKAAVEEPSSNSAVVAFKNIRKKA